MGWASILRVQRSGSSQKLHYEGPAAAAGAYSAPQALYSWIKGWGPAGRGEESGIWCWEGIGGGKKGMTEEGEWWREECRVKRVIREMVGMIEGNSRGRLKWGRIVQF